MLNLVCFLIGLLGVACWFWEFLSTVNKKTFFKFLAIAILLFAPFNYKGNIYTVLGSAASEGDNYSVVSFYQKAGHDAHSGISFIQVAGNNAGSMLSFYQSAERGDAKNFIGILNWQEAGRVVSTFMGITICQKAGSGFNVYGNYYLPKSWQWCFHGRRAFYLPEGK